MIADLKLALRQLAKSPGFTAVVVLTLALGLGATTAIYSVVNGVLLRPLAFHEPDRLVFLNEWMPGTAFGAWPASARHFVEWRKQTTVFEHLTVIDPGTVALSGRGEAERLDLVRVSADCFATLGVPPALGRGFLPGEDEAGRNHVVIISDALWRQRFGADPAVLGTAILLDDEAYTVVGVLPAWFRFPSAHALLSYQTGLARPEVFVPKAFSADELGSLMGDFNYGVIARLKPGVTAEAALAELNGIGARLSRLAGEKVDLRAIVTPLQETIVGKARTGLFLLLGATTAVLLIICVNLANLLLVRAEARAGDAAIRLALGASRAQLLWRSLGETMLLALAGGGAGIAVAAAALRLLVRAGPADLPRLDEVRLDGGALGFALVLTVLTSLTFSVGPAWCTARTDPQNVLRARGRAVAGGGRRLRASLIVVESGLSAALLVVAGLLVSSFSRLLRVDLGFSAPTVLAADVDIPGAKYREPDQRNGFFERVVARLQAAPGVAAAAFTSALPLRGETWIDGVWQPGDTRPEFERPSSNVRFVSPDYFGTLGISLLAGRTFAASDRGRKVAVVSERLARMLWPGLDALGRTLESGWGRYEVIGIVGDVRADAHKPAVPIFYHPHWDWPPLRSTIVVRAVAGPATGRGDPRSVAGAIRQAVHQVDADVPVVGVRTMQEVLAGSLAQRHFQLVLAAVFAGTALALTALGIYGVVACSVSRRTGEMGVRAALGASPSDLRWMVIRQGMAPVALGLAAGLALALACGRALGGLLYEVKPGDPVILAATAFLLLLVSLAACWLPAGKATRADPVIALRTD